MAIRLSLLIFALFLPACGQEEEEVLNEAAVEQKWRISGPRWAQTELLVRLLRGKR